MAIRTGLAAAAIALAAGAVACGGEPIAPQGAPEGPSTSAPTARNTADPRPREERPENPAPDFSVATFDGGRFALDEHRGVPVVLNFWESW